MNRSCRLLIAALGLFSQASSSQYNPDTNALVPVRISPLVDQSSAIPEGHSIRLAVSYPPYELTSKSVHAVVSVGIAGVLEATYRHEGIIGSPVELLPPASEIDFRFQIIPQREQFPAVSVFLNTMTETQSDLLGEYSLRDNLPGIYQDGLSLVNYDVKSAVSGITLSSAFGETWSINAAVGVREVWWHQQWSKYRIAVPYLTGSDGWTFPLSERSALNLDWSANVAARLIRNLTLLAEIHALPVMDIDPSTLVVEARERYAGAIGVRYALPIALNVDFYDRWFSKGGGRPDSHQVRIGLSTDLTIH